MKVILLNGPPRCGKDTAGKAIVTALGGEVAKFADALKVATHALYGMTWKAADAFEDTKEIPSGCFFGRSARAAYIEVSERMVKPVLGQEFFGRVLAQKLVQRRDAGCALVAVTDSGFAHEATPVVNAIGAKNVLLVRIHAEARGCSFRGDSRGYIELLGVATMDVLSDSDVEGFRMNVLGAVRGWLDAA